MALQNNEQFELELRSPLTLELVASLFVGSGDLVMGVKRSLEILLDVPRCCQKLLRDGQEQPLADNSSLLQAGVGPEDPVLQLIILPPPEEDQLNAMCQRAAAELNCDIRGIRAGANKFRQILGHKDCCCGQVCFRHAVRHCSDPDSTSISVPNKSTLAKRVREAACFSWLKGRDYSPLHLAAEYGDAKTCSFLLQDPRFAKVVRKYALSSAISSVEKHGGDFKLQCGQDFRCIAYYQRRDLRLFETLPEMPKLQSWVWSNKDGAWLPHHIAMKTMFKRKRITTDQADATEAMEKDEDVDYACNLKTREKGWARAQFKGRRARQNTA